MNYLSHYWLDKGRLPDMCLYGSALVDVCRMRGTGFRLKPAGASTEEEALLEAGIKRHYEVDAWWHNSPEFEQLAAFAKEVIKETLPNLIRPTFLAHIGAEMILDRALLIKYPDLANEFYALFTPHAVDLASEYAVRQQPDSMAQRIKPELERFAASRFLERYNQDKYLSETLAGIYGHITKDRVFISPSAITDLIYAILPKAADLISKLRRLI